MRKEELKEEILNLSKEANEMSLGDLCERVLRYSYTPGIHDEILLKRCKELSCNKIKEDYTNSPYPYDHS